MTSPKRLFLIDGMAQIYRAHFAMIKNPLITKDGRHTSAIFGFINSLFKLLREENPDYVAVVLDCKEPTFRHELYTEYKATREKMPDELVEQLNPLFEVISHTNIPILKKPGFEADDIIGTLVKKAEQAGLVTYMVTGDKDMMQLVSETTFMYSPGNRFKPTTIYDKAKVKEKWGVGPEGIIDMLALVGDTSDNVPGVDGVGPNTARNLLAEYKATREKMPDELVEQLEPLFEVISNTKIPILKKPGFEADDIIGTLVKKAELAGLVTYMVTGDKDMMQLVSETTFMYSPGNRFKPTTIYDKAKVKEKWGVGPEGIIDMLALVGDTSDNIPGVDGVGPKTA